MEKNEYISELTGKVETYRVMDGFSYLAKNLLPIGKVEVTIFSNEEFEFNLTNLQESLKHNIIIAKLIKNTYPRHKIQEFNQESKHVLKYYVYIDPDWENLIKAGKIEKRTWNVKVND